MRRTLRPFVKEFKHRSVKAPLRSSAAAEESVEKSPSFLDLAAPLQPVVVAHDDSYEAAMRAADLVFGKKSEPAPAPVPEPVLADAVEAPVLPTATGRVLPSLIEAETPAPEPRGARKKERKPRAPRAESAAEPAPTRAPRAERAPKPAVRRRPAALEETATAVVQPAIAQANVEAAPLQAQGEPAAPRRLRRPIQLRWVLQKELKAGERWKRRLPENAR
jgi:hypothetical protein